MFENKLPISSHVRVSEAQVVVMVAQVSYDATFAEFVREVVGFAVFVKAIIVDFYAWF